jgi:hypothetical protein
MAIGDDHMPLGSRDFSLVLVCTLFIAVLCLAVAVYLTTLPPSQTVKSLIDKVMSVFTLATGAIIGLLGGKALG